MDPWTTLRMMILVSGNKACADRYSLEFLGEGHQMTAELSKTVILIVITICSKTLDIMFKTCMIY